MIAILVSAVLFVWFFSRKQLLQRIAQLELDKKTANSNYLILLEEYMKKTSSIPQSAREHLEELKKTYSNVNSDIAAELCIVLEMLDSGKEAIAIEKLTKIIENILKTRLAALEQSGKKKPLMEMIKDAVSLKIITKRTAAFADALRAVRNEEAHELNVQLTPAQVVLCVLAGVSILLELSATQN
jgi:transcription termination factor NusB